jgi:hypothetical protein
MLQHTGVYDRASIRINRLHIRDPPNVRSYWSEHVFTLASQLLCSYTTCCQRIRNEEKHADGKRGCVELCTSSDASFILAALKLQEIGGIYKHFTRMAPADSEFLINLMGAKISKRIPYTERLLQLKGDWLLLCGFWLRAILTPA